MFLFVVYDCSSYISTHFFFCILFLKEVLESAIDICKFPPIPDAICRFEKCHGHVKAEIYFTDPDFKVNTCRLSQRSSSLHWNVGKHCWFKCLCRASFGYAAVRAVWLNITWRVGRPSRRHRSLKRMKRFVWISKQRFLNSKSFHPAFLRCHFYSLFVLQDFLQGPCLTPDCVGKISSIKIFGPTGLVKCKVRWVCAGDRRLKSHGSWIGIGDLTSFLSTVWSCHSQTADSKEAQSESEVYKVRLHSSTLTTGDNTENKWC